MKFQTSELLPLFPDPNYPLPNDPHIIPIQHTSPQPTHLQTDGDIDPAAETGADRPGTQRQAGEEATEGGTERDPGPLLRHHDTGAHTGEVHPALTQQRDGRRQALRTQLHHAWGRVNRQEVGSSGSLHIYTTVYLHGLFI